MMVFVMGGKTYLRFGDDIIDLKGVTVPKHLQGEWEMFVRAGLGRGCIKCFNRMCQYQGQDDCFAHAEILRDRKCTPIDRQVRDQVTKQEEKVNEKTASLASVTADAQVEFVRSYMIEKIRNQEPQAAGANLGLVDMYKTMPAVEIWKMYFADFTQALCATLGVVPDANVKHGLVYDYCLNRFGKSFESLLDDDSIDISDDIVFQVTAMVQEAASDFMEQVDDLTSPAELIQPLDVEVRPVIVMKRGIDSISGQVCYYEPVLFIEVSHKHVRNTSVQGHKLYFPVTGL